jgi:hypothetical protein
MDLRRRREQLHGDRIRPHTAHAAIRLANNVIGEVRLVVTLFVIAFVVSAILAVAR